LHPLEKKYTCHKALFNQNYLYFWIFPVALQQVGSAHAGHTHCVALMAGEARTARFISRINLQTV